MDVGDLVEWFGPDLVGKEVLPSPLDASITVGVFGENRQMSFGQPKIIAIWPDGPNALGLGRFGRLRALARAVDGRPLRVSYSVRPYLKLVTYVPESHIEEVRAAICQAGAGNIGQYAMCTWSAMGEGTFLPLKDAHPFIGKPGKLEKVRERRLETIVPRWRREQVEAALKATHPYEEVAFDWISLENALTLPEGYENEQGWWCGEVTSAVVELAAILRPVVIHAEKASWSVRKGLYHLGISLAILAPGSILLPGLEQMNRDRRPPWA